MVVTEITEVGSLSTVRYRQVTPTVPQCGHRMYCHRGVHVVYHNVDIGCTVIGIHVVYHNVDIGCTVIEVSM